MQERHAMFTIVNIDQVVQDPNVSIIRSDHVLGGALGRHGMKKTVDYSSYHHLFEYPVSTKRSEHSSLHIGPSGTIT